jgi:hypothetical protein
MPKGKKFDAAEKHFTEKEIKYQQKIKEQEQTVTHVIKSYGIVTEQNRDLIEENNQLKQWVSRLLEYTKLSEADIREVCEHDKKLGNAVDAFSRILQSVYTPQK